MAASLRGLSIQLVLLWMVFVRRFSTCPHLSRPRAAFISHGHADGAVTGIRGDVRDVLISRLFVCREGCASLKELHEPIPYPSCRNSAGS